MAQALDSFILTQTGFVPLGELAEGSLILDSAGKEQEITGITEGRDVPLLEVISEDGYVTKTTPEQEWRIYDSDYKTSRIVTSQYMMENPAETYVLPKANLTTYHHPDRVEGKVFPPTPLGLMLRETDPVAGTLSLVTDSPLELTSHFPIPPSYALTEGASYRLIWEEEDLEEHPVYPWLEAANLFSGKYEEFSIPMEYLNATMEIRSQLVYALTGHPRPLAAKKWGLELPHWGNLPLDHPEYGPMLHLLTVSLGMYETFSRRTVAKVTQAEKLQDVRTLALAGGTGNYITDGFMVTGGGK